MSESLRVLALNPFHGGSHRAFIESVVARSRCRWDVLTDRPVHWKWRMRSAPLTLAAAALDYRNTHEVPDRIFCTDMLDVPGWLGLTRRSGLDGVPLVLYMHENQWTYPVPESAAQHQIDHHYGYTNLLSVIAADACVFNSEFHRADFLAASKRFVQQMPDGKSFHNWEAIAAKSWVIAPGFVPFENPSPDRKKNFPVTSQHAAHPDTTSRPMLRVGWVSRWEGDKRPDRLLELCDRLLGLEAAFELILLGPRPRRESKPLSVLRHRHGERILHDGFAESRSDYHAWLGRMDIVVSFADHEFFGIAICEAIHAGAIPVVPDRLSYLETTPDCCRFQSMDQAVKLATKFSDEREREQTRRKCQETIARFQINQTVSQIDELMESL